MKKITLFLVALLVSMATFAQLTSGSKLYLKVSDKVWVPEGHYFWAHFNGGDRGVEYNFKMTQVEGEEFVYSVDVPSASTAFSGVIFYCNVEGLDMGLIKANSGDTKGYTYCSQTFTPGEIGAFNMFTIDGTTDKINNILVYLGDWSAYTPTTVEPEPEPEPEVEVAEGVPGGKMFYLKVSDKLWVPKGYTLWLYVYEGDRLSDDKRFVEMKLVEGEEFVYCAVTPASNVNFGGIAFLRIQTGTTPTNTLVYDNSTRRIEATVVGKNNMFTVTSNGDNSSGMNAAKGTWSVYTKPTVEPEPDPEPEVVEGVPGGKMFYLKVSDKLWVPKGYTLWLYVYEGDRLSDDKRFVEMKLVEGEEFVYCAVTPASDLNFGAIAFLRIQTGTTPDILKYENSTSRIEATVVGKNNMFTVTSNGGSNVLNPAKGTWSVYTKATVEPEPEPEPEVEVTRSYKFENNWTNESDKWEKVYACFWNSEKPDVVVIDIMTNYSRTYGTGIYGGSPDVPESYTKMRFQNARENPTKFTEDLDFPTTITNPCYSPAEKRWYTFGGYVAGTAALCNGKEWDPSSAENKMTKTSSIYSITYENVPAGLYKFKVTLGTWVSAKGYNNIDATNSTPGYMDDNGNISFMLPSADNVTISYDPLNEVITLKAATLEKFAEWEATSYTLCGDFPMLDWVTSNAANHMEKGADDVWTKTYDNVTLEAKEYQYKVAANDDWGEGEFPRYVNQTFTVTEAGLYKLTFTYNPKVESNKLNCVAEKINSPATYVEDVTVLNVYTQNGLVVVDGEFQIFTVTGQNVTEMNGNLEKGVYVVRTATAATKVVVR